MATLISSIQSDLHFPPELWSMTTRNFRHRKSPDELTYLWTTVRRVSRQFKEEIEEIFRTEHLPKTWLHVDISESLFAPPPSLRQFIDVGVPHPVCDNKPDRLKLYDFECKLNYDKIQPRYPGRAVFSCRLDHKRYPPFLKTAMSRRKIFERLRNEAGPGRLGEADKSVPGSRIRVFDSPVGMFVVQVRGSVGDCAVPVLNIDSSRHEVSFDWRDLFDQFFGEQKVVKAGLHDTLVGHSDLRHHSLYPI